MTLCLTLISLGCAAAVDEAADSRDGRGCVPNERRCSNDGTQTCGPDGLWQRVAACPGACQGGICVDRCQDECRLGERRCVDAGAQICIEGAFGCSAWNEPDPCIGGAICLDGRCRPGGCGSPCAVGERRCASPASFAECVNLECASWVGPEACPAGTMCSGGACVGGGMCTDQCRDGAIVCRGQRQVQRCVRAPNGCLDYSDGETCPDGMVCQAGEGCVRPCETNTCEVGTTRCFEGGQQTCVRDAMGCVSWSEVESCLQNEQCTRGACRAPCESECGVSTRRCVEGGYQVCRRVERCGRWGDVSACPANTRCLGAGQCGRCESGTREERRCGTCGTQHRVCDGGNWNLWSNCYDEGGECDPDRERACGDCGVSRCTEECVWGPCEAEGECAPGNSGECGECGQRVCNEQCRWGACNNGDGTGWRPCADCGWEFCCPEGDWCNDCAGHFPKNCEPGTGCEANGACL
jgi:hypothetical protein